MMRRKVLAVLLLTIAAILFIVTLTVATPSDVLLTYHRHFQNFVTAHYGAALLLFAASYVLVTALGTPGSLVISVIGGVLFDGLVGGAASILAATLGGTILFSAVQAGFGHVITRRLPARFSPLIADVRRDEFFYLLFLRLMPLLPFFVINLLAALAGVRRLPFVTATLIGIAPMNFALAYTGAGLQDLVEKYAELFMICDVATPGSCPSLAVGDLLTASMLMPLFALAFLAIVPVVARHYVFHRT
jgi:uncharacterized membrane protein YdjX (TVP38/TMEM64 family)